MKQKIPLKYFAYGFGAVEPMKFETQSNFLEKLNKWGFKINPISKLSKMTKKLVHNIK